MHLHTCDHAACCTALQASLLLLLRVLALHHPHGLQLVSVLNSEVALLLTLLLGVLDLLIQGLQQAVHDHCSGGTLLLVLPVPLQRNHQVCILIVLGTLLQQSLQLVQGLVIEVVLVGSIACQQGTLLKPILSNPSCQELNWTVQPYDNALLHVAPVLGTKNRTPTGRDNKPLVRCQFLDYLCFTVAEVVLPELLEDFSNRFLIVRELDHSVRVKVPILQGVGQHFSQGALATAHHAHQVNAAATELLVDVLCQICNLRAEQVKVCLLGRSLRACSCVRLSTNNDIHSPFQLFP
mmetsp:Transcript_13648/g.29274  ORF Transcript_13648/g.29274 Transcript_13648/m.29274 type:complete len:294 (+) Transcript_13648:631-1512(+)